MKFNNHEHLTHSVFGTLFLFFIFLFFYFFILFVNNAHLLFNYSNYFSIIQIIIQLNYYSIIYYIFNYLIINQLFNYYSIN